MSRHENKKRRKAALGVLLAWGAAVFATATLAVPTGNFLVGVLNTMAWFCYLIALTFHGALALSMDFALKNRWNVNGRGMMIGCSCGVVFFVVIVAVLAYIRYNTYIEDGEAPFFAAFSATLWFLLESGIPIICGLGLAQASDEAQRRTENCQRFDALTEQIESNPGHERRIWDAAINHVLHDLKETKRHHSDARRLITQLEYVAKQLKFYHPDPDVPNDEDGDDDPNAGGVNGDGPQKPLGPTPNLLNVYTSATEHNLTRNGR